MVSMLGARMVWVLLLLEAISVVCYEAKAMDSPTSPHDQSSVFFVVPFNESRPSWCVYSVPCHTLDEYVIDGTLNTSDANFVFLNGTHQLNQSLMVYESANLTLRGNAGGKSSVQVVCESRWNIAVSFTRVSSLTIQNISFINCSYNNSFAGSKKTEYVVSALHFEEGSDLTLSDVRILNGGFSIINTQGHVEITGMNVTSHFYEKANSRNLTQSFGGSYIHYSSCGSRRNLTIFESFFQFHNKHFFAPPVLQKHKFGSHGLGLILINCTNLQVIIRKTILRGYQSAGVGGNMIISLQKSRYKTSHCYIVTISECHIEGGHALEGGGAFISIVQPYLSNKLKELTTINHTKLRILNILNVSFVNNSALGGGGGGLSFKLKKFSRDSTIGYIQIKQCKFESNHLKAKVSYGGIAVHISAFHVTPSTYHTSPSFNITLKNCLVQDNYIHDDKECSAGNGVVTLVKVLHFHVENSTFIENHCTVIKAIASNVVLKGHVNFTSNSGSSGGGLLLCDDSVMILKPNTLVTIVNNSVIHTGGGITVESQCLQTRPMCFFQLSDEITYNSSLLDTVEIKLFKNSARFAGHNLFGGSIDNCYLVYPPQYYKNRRVTTKVVFQKVFRNLTSTNSSVTSIARRICFCDNGERNCSKENLLMEAFPGETFPVSAVPIGQMDGTVPASVRAHVKPYDVTTISPSELIQNIEKSKCSQLNYTVNSDRSHMYIDLHIQHEGDISGYIKLNLYKSARVTVTLKQCPTGFKLDKNCPQTPCKCTCDTILPKSVTCDIKRQTITKPTWMWIGLISDPYEKNSSSQKYFTFRRCPFDYCHPITIESGENTVSATVLAEQLVQDTQCQLNRTGILCGACGQNLSMSLGSSKCWSCPNKTLVLLIAFALAGILLIIFLTVLDLTISEGKMSGLIFYANIVHINDTLFIPVKWGMFSSVLQTFIAWINLDLGVNACFYNGMDAYAKAWLQFAFPLYLWLLSGLIVFLCNRYISVTRLFGTNSVRVLATVVLLSFTKLLRAIITTFSCLNLQLHRNNTNKTRSLWTSDPNIPCFQGKHIPLFAFGVIFSVVWLIFIIFMLFIQCWPRLRCCYWIQRLKPFTDSFTGPNTSYGRFWTGLLLLSRLAIAVAYNIYGNRENKNNFYICAAIPSICLLLISACLPSGMFNKQSSNILEISFHLNLVFITLGAACESKHVMYLSVSSVLVKFIGLLVYHCWLRMKSVQCSALIQAKLSRIMATVLTRELIVKESKKMAVNDSIHCSMDEEREPLLADMAS